MSDLTPLVSHDAIASLTAAKKKSLLAAVTKELGKEWKAEPLDDALGLPLLHVPTKLRFRLIPGGSFTMGLTAEDIEQCEQYAGDYPDEIVALKKRATPLRQVSVAPFLITEQPLDHLTLKRLLPGYEGDELPKRKVAVEIAERHGFRLPSEAELEWLARSGTQASFVTDLVGGGALSLDDEKTVTFDHKKAVSRFGVKGLLSALWAADDWHGSYKGAPTDSEPWLGGKPDGVVRWTSLTNILCAGSEMLWGFLSVLREKPGEPGQVMLVAPLSRFIPALIGQKPPAPPKKKAAAKKVLPKEAMSWRKLKTLKGNGQKLPEWMKEVGGEKTARCSVSWHVSQVFEAVVRSGEWCTAVPAVVEEGLRLLPKAAMPEMLLMLLSHVVGNDQMRAWLAPATEATHTPVLEVLERHRELLLAQLTSDSATVRSAAATLLMTIGEWRDETIPKLMAMVEGDAEPMVRASAVLALSRLGEGRPECEEMIRLASADSSRGPEVHGSAAVGRLRLDATTSYELAHEGLRAWLGLPLPTPTRDSDDQHIAVFHWFGATWPQKQFEHSPWIWPFFALSAQRGDTEALLETLLGRVATEPDPHLLREIEPLVLKLGGFLDFPGEAESRTLLPCEFRPSQQRLLALLANALVPINACYGLPACGSVRRRWLGVEPPGPLEESITTANGATEPRWRLEPEERLTGLTGFRRFRAMVESAANLYSGLFWMDEAAREMELANLVVDDRFLADVPGILAPLVEWQRLVISTGSRHPTAFRVSNSLIHLLFLRVWGRVEEQWLIPLDYSDPHGTRILEALDEAQVSEHLRWAVEHYRADGYPGRVLAIVPGRSAASVVLAGVLRPGEPAFNRDRYVHTLDPIVRLSKQHSDIAQALTDAGLSDPWRLLEEQEAKLTKDHSTG